MFAAAGTLLNISKRAQNQGKVHVLQPFESVMLMFYCVQPVRYHLDAWDEMMMDRDKRLTGHERGQSVSCMTVALLRPLMVVYPCSPNLTLRKVSRQAAFGILKKRHRISVEQCCPYCSQASVLTESRCHRTVL